MSTTDTIVITKIDLPSGENDVSIVVEFTKVPVGWTDPVTRQGIEIRVTRVTRQDSGAEIAFHELPLLTREDIFSACEEKLK